MYLHMFAKAASLKTYPETLYLWTLWGGGEPGVWQ